MRNPKLVLPKGPATDSPEVCKHTDAATWNILEAETSQKKHKIDRQTAIEVKNKENDE